jgi:hypothetical protein
MNEEIGTIVLAIQTEITLIRAFLQTVPAAEEKAEQIGKISELIREMVVSPLPISATREKLDKIIKG